MMGSPTDYRRQNYPLVNKRSVRVIAYCIAQQMGITGRIRQIILAIVLMHPGCLKETMRVAGFQRVSSSIRYQDGTRRFCKLQHIISQLYDTTRQGRLIIARQTRMLDCLIVAITLQLSSPDSTEINIDTAIIIFENGRVDAVASFYRIRLRNKRAFGFLADSDSQTEYIVLILHGEIQIIPAVLLGDITVPQLPACPGNIFYPQHDTMIYHFTTHNIICREYMIIFHVKMIAIVIFGNTALPVMRRINIHSIIKHMH